MQNFGSVPASKQAFCEQQVFLEIVQKRGISALRTPGILARPPQRVLSIHNYSPNMVTMRYIVFELRSFCCLANQRLCLVTIATRVNRDTFFKTGGHTLRIGIQHALVNLWKSAEI